MSLDEQIKSSDQAMKVQGFLDDRIVKFAELEMKAQKHIAEMRQQEVAIAVDRENLWALRHARLTLRQEVRKIRKRIDEAEESAEKMEKDIRNCYRLLSPAAIYVDRVGRHWSSLAKYAFRSRIEFDAGAGKHLFMNSRVNTYQPAELVDMTAGELVTHCRYKQLLVKPKTKTFEKLVELVEESISYMLEIIETVTKEVEAETEKLQAILESHWETQGIG